MVLHFGFLHGNEKDDHVRARSLELHKTDGTSLFIGWAESTWEYRQGITNGKCKGIEFNGEPAEGRIAELDSVERVIIHPDCDGEETVIPYTEPISLIWMDGSEQKEFRNRNGNKVILKSN